MSVLSRPASQEGPESDLRALAYRGVRVVCRFLLTGEDAHHLEQLAKERGFTVDALAKQFVIEGIWRARTVKEL